MSIGNGAWPGGFDAVERDKGFESLEGELYDWLKNTGEASTDSINYFLRQVFAKEDVVVERRSFMRYLRSDERFIFRGTTRSRTIMVTEKEVIEGWGEVAEKIIDIMLLGTRGEDGTHFTISEKELRKNLGINSSSDNGSFDKAIEMLCYFRRIGGSGEYGEDLSYGWEQGSFLGFSPVAKKSSGVNLPPRTWKVAKQLTHKINAHKEEKLERYFSSKTLSPEDKREISNVLQNQGTTLLNDISNRAIIKLAMNRPGNISTSELFELAIEVLREDLEI
jgi:hypothetical protein